MEGNVTRKVYFTGSEEGAEDPVAFGTQDGLPSAAWPPAARRGPRCPAPSWSAGPAGFPAVRWASQVLPPRGAPGFGEGAACVRAGGPLAAGRLPGSWVCRHGGLPQAEAAGCPPGVPARCLPRKDLRRHRRVTRWDRLKQD